jgi:hypothetical protein
LILWVLLVALALAEPQPSDHALVYYNARMALREGQAVEAVKLWLLRNTLEDQTGRVSQYDPDFHSVTWAALGQTGICQDGFPTDDDGAGLWPIALHNHVVRNMGRRGAPRRPRPFDAFELDRQQRFVSISDVLSAEELRAVRLFRGRCMRPRLALVEAGLPVNADLSDRQVVASLLRHLLVRSRATLADDDVRGKAVIEARLFDIDLQLAALAAREARADARELARRGRTLGLSSGSIEALREGAPLYTLEPDSEAARILRSCVAWPVSEWMALSPDRRLFLFGHARSYGGDPASLERIALGVIDELIMQGEGEDVERWIAHRAVGDDPAAHEVIWGGERGARLLALERDTGFRERSVIALNRGVDELERGDLPSALRSLAYALQHAPDSRSSDTVASLSRRWLSYVASQYEITDALLVTLQELVPRRDYGIILEDLMWRSAFHADGESFERGLRNQAGRGALERRLALLGPLATGDVRRFSAGIAQGLERSPSETLRFLNQLVQRLELEDADVRGAQLPTLEALQRLLAPIVEEGGGTGRRGRSATALVGRFQAIQEGLGGLGPDAGPRDHARALAPGGEVFAGSVRLAPADPIPWPFRPSEIPAPSVFTPLPLTPEEWRSGSGEVVFGWSLGG